eukprot:gnl/Chilomastix_cuspidata/6517.p2 GENE.gnl/Chilomastix_cuspidata/6517~~gnl/Chilomastix_cuspidata/6517.p2  ORF type:complete len:107 (-),score=46.99 gnl/Chilomastix_cuspidata/6517:16-309(-)
MKPNPPRYEMYLRRERELARLQEPARCNALMLNTATWHEKTFETKGGTGKKRVAPPQAPAAQPTPLLDAWGAELRELYARERSEQEEQLRRLGYEVI